MMRAMTVLTMAIQYATVASRFSKFHPLVT